MRGNIVIYWIRFAECPVLNVFNRFIDGNGFFNQNPSELINFEQNSKDLSGRLDRVPMAG